MNTDPSLLDYFKPHRELRDGLEYVDRSGGANPLTLVVSSANGAELNTDAAYEKMWRLQGAFENYKDVDQSYRCQRFWPKAIVRHFPSSSATKK